VCPYFLACLFIVVATAGRFFLPRAPLSLTLRYHCSAVESLRASRSCFRAACCPIGCSLVVHQEAPSGLRGFPEAALEYSRGWCQLVRSNGGCLRVAQSAHFRFDLNPFRCRHHSPFAATGFQSRSTGTCRIRDDVASSAGRLGRKAVESSGDQLPVHLTGGRRQVPKHLRLESEKTYFISGEQTAARCSVNLLKPGFKPLVK